MWSLSSTSACYFLLLWKQTTFVFSCSLINKKHFYMGGLEWPFFSPLFRFPLFYILHTCSVSEAHFVIWNICGTLLWRRPTLLLLLLPVFISHWFADVVLRRLRLASAAPGRHGTAVGFCDLPEGSCGVTTCQLPSIGREETQVSCGSSCKHWCLYFQRNLREFICDAIAGRHILIRTKGTPTWGSHELSLLSSHNIFTLPLYPTKIIQIWNKHQGKE